MSSMNLVPPLKVRMVELLEFFRSPSSSRLSFGMPDRGSGDWVRVDKGISTRGDAGDKGDDGRAACAALS
jgi:hypothetical protein